jgi:hypothetical protein
LPHLNAVDQLCLWTWRPDDLKNLEANFEALERLVPNKELFLGCYRYDFHKGKPLSVDRMKHQTELAHRWLRENRIKGTIFLSNGIADVGLEAVAWTRQWITDHGDEKVSLTDCHIHCIDRRATARPLLRAKAGRLQVRGCEILDGHAARGHVVLEDGVAYATISDNTSRAPFKVINNKKGKTVVRDNISEA